MSLQSEKMLVTTEKKKSRVPVLADKAKRLKREVIEVWVGDNKEYVLDSISDMLKGEDQVPFPILELNVEGVKFFFTIPEILGIYVLKGFCTSENYQEVFNGLSMAYDHKSQTDFFRLEEHVQIMTIVIKADPSLSRYCSGDLVSVLGIARLSLADPYFAVPVVYILGAMDKRFAEFGVVIQAARGLTDHARLGIINTFFPEFAEVLTQHYYDLTIPLSK